MRADSILIGSTTIAIISATASTRGARIYKSRCQKAIVYHKRAINISQIRKSSPISNCGGGGITITKPFTISATAKVSPRTGRKPNGIRTPSRSLRWNTDLPPATSRRTSRTSSLTQNRPKASRPTGRSGIRPTSSGYLPRRDDTIQALALQAVYEYWNVDGNNESVGGLPMLNWNFCCVWNTDARPFPTFPVLNSAWGDAGNWPQGLWIGTTRAILPPPSPSLPPTPPEFPTLAPRTRSCLVCPHQAEIQNGDRSACERTGDADPAVRDTHISTSI